MKMRGKIVSFCVLPIILTGVFSVLIGMYQYSTGMYQEIRESLKASAIAALNVYNSQGYGDYAIKDDGEVWRGMNFNVSGETEIVDTIKKETGVDITFFYQETAVMTSMTDGSDGRYIGMKTGKNITNYTLKQGAQMYYRNIDIGGKMYHAYIIPITQPDSGGVIGALMATRSVERLESAMRENEIILGSVICVIMIFFVIYAVVFVHSLVREIHFAGGVVKKVSSGELSVQEKKGRERKDELGELDRDIEVLQKRLVEIVGKIRKSSAVLNQAAVELNDTSDSTLTAAKEMTQSVEMISQTTSNQATESQTVSEDMHHMDAMLNSSMQEVDEMHHLSKEMYQMSQETAHVLKELEESNEKSKQTMEVIYEQTNTTNMSAQEIKTVTEFITSIADETNLLALNASIEAARAGDAGKGFAVVANEIQGLAIQTNTRAQQIQEIVASLVDKTEHAVEAMEQVKDTMGQQSQKVVDTQESFDKLGENITTSTKKIVHISELTKQIGEVKSSMTESIEKVSVSADGNASAAQQTSAMTVQVEQEFAKVSDLASQLQELASQLEEDVSFFHWETDTNAKV
ncbi:MAG: methyl-accepting chemotaxis protein [Lachnospiraceae bacterium]